MSVENLISKTATCDSPTPDMTILNQTRRRPPQLPLELLGPELSEWMHSAANSAGAPLDYVFAGLMALSSILIGNARRASPWEGWIEPCVLWVGLVGDPSSGKSPALDPIRSIINTLEKELTDSFEADYLVYETKKQAARCLRAQWEKKVKEAIDNDLPEPQMPHEAIEPQEIERPRILCSDISTEKLALLLSSCPKGLVLYRDELSGLFGSFDRYSGKDGDRAFILEAYGGRPYTVDRVKHKKPIEIAHLSASILGCIQPDKLVNLMQDADDGFTARFIWVWPDPIPPLRPESKPKNDAIITAMRRLFLLTLKNNDKGIQEPCIVHLSEVAAFLFQKWREEHFINEQNIHGLLKSYYGKVPGQLLRLALVIEFLWWSVRPNALEPCVISDKAITAAAHFMEAYFKPMAERVYGDAAIPEVEYLATILARYILRVKAKLINVRKIGREAGLPGLRKSEKIIKAVEILTEADWLFPVHTSGVGRPRGDYTVNPKLWEVLHDEVA